MLGHPFALIGEVVVGEKLGGKLGLPTANLAVENELLPAKGVYVTMVAFESAAYRSVTNVGIRPTVGGTKLTVEAHLLNFSRNIYGTEMEIQFLKRIRDEKRFVGLDQLKAQIHDDIEYARDYFNRT